MAVNWGLAQNPTNALFGMGLQLGQNLVDRRDQREERNALLGMRQQEMDQRAQDRAAQQQQQQTQQRRADLPLMERLLTMAQDEPSYQQARQVAGQYGIDVSALPPTFDPAWRDQQLQTVKLLNTPQGQEALSTAGKQAVDMGYQPGSPEFTQVTRQLVEAALAQPYTGGQGETRLYTPQIGGPGQVQGGPQPGAVEDGYRFKGGNPADPNAWEPMQQGGPTPQASAGFPGS
jgi:hypothetical protein